VAAVVLAVVGFAASRIVGDGHANAATPPMKSAGSTRPPVTTQTTSGATTSADTTSPQTNPANSGATVSSQPKLAALRPAIWWHPIPFGAKRLAESAAYAKRHYGIDSWHLIHPKMIVEHYTATTTWQSAWSTFSQDVPDGELHELPGTCAHFIIAADVRIIQDVKTTVICRHTVGLNWTAIGIEHVGTSDQQILSDPAQMRSSLRLTAYLMAKYHVAIGNVIGHNESLNSRYHHELYPSWRCQTHQDWQHSDMQIYRHRLAIVLRREGVVLGSGYHAVASGC
jgi:beta-N-acetylhexosaminidase